MAATTPSGPSNRPPWGTESRCEPDHTSGSTGLCASQPPDEVAVRVDLHVEAGLAHPRGHKTMRFVLRGRRADSVGTGPSADRVDRVETLLDAVVHRSALRRWDATRPRDELAATVRAHAAVLGGAEAAEGALPAADPRPLVLRRQTLTAQLARIPHLERHVPDGSAARPAWIRVDQSLAGDDGALPSRSRRQCGREADAFRDLARSGSAPADPELCYSTKSSWTGSGNAPIADPRRSSSATAVRPSSP